MTNSFNLDENVIVYTMQKIQPCTNHPKRGINPLTMPLCTMANRQPRQVNGTLHINGAKGTVQYAKLTIQNPKRVTRLNTILTQA